MTPIATREIDDHLEFGGLHDRQTVAPGSPERSDPGASWRCLGVRSVIYGTGFAGGGEIYELGGILAHITGTVDQELLLRNEYLAAENRILKIQLQGRVKLSDAERATLAEIGHRLGRKALDEVATIARPDTILAWYRKLVARKFDGSLARRTPGRPQIARDVEQLIVRMAEENPSWGYDRIVGALAKLGHKVSDQTVGNVLRRHSIPPAPERKHTTTWAAFIRAHLAVLAGTDFFTVEVLTLHGLVTYYVLFSSIWRVAEWRSLGSPPTRPRTG
jgi:putative transposase